MQLLLPSPAVPCQNVLDYFRNVLEFNNQLIQTLPEEQFTEVSPPPQNPSAYYMLLVPTGLTLTGLLPPQEEERQTVFEVCATVTTNLEQSFKSV